CNCITAGLTRRREGTKKKQDRQETSVLPVLMSCCSCSSSRLCVRLCLGCGAGEDFFYASQHEVEVVRLGHDRRCEAQHPLVRVLENRALFEQQLREVMPVRAVLCQFNPEHHALAAYFLDARRSLGDLR